LCELILSPIEEGEIMGISAVTEMMINAAFSE